MTTLFSTRGDIFVVVRNRLVTVFGGVLSLPFFFVRVDANGCQI